MSSQDHAATVRDALMRAKWSDMGMEDNEPERRHALAALDALLAQAETAAPSYRERRLTEKWEAAEARLAQTQDALQRIATFHGKLGDIARAALTGEGTE